MLISGNSIADPANMLDEIISETIMCTDSADRFKAVDSILGGLSNEGLGISKHLVEKLHCQLYRSSKGTIPTIISEKLKYLSTTSLTPIPVERKERTVESSETEIKKFQSMRIKLKQYYEKDDLIEYEKSLEIFRRKGFQMCPIIYSQLIKLYITAGFFIQALESYNQAVAEKYSPKFYLTGKEIIKFLAQLIENDKMAEALKFLDANKTASRVPQFYAECQLFALLDYYKEQNMTTEARDLYTKLDKQNAFARIEFKVGFVRKLKQMKVKIAIF